MQNAYKLELEVEIDQKRESEGSLTIVVKS